MDDLLLALSVIDPIGNVDHAAGTTGDHTLCSGGFDVPYFFGVDLS